MRWSTVLLLAIALGACTSQESPAPPLATAPPACEPGLLEVLAPDLEALARGPAAALTHPDTSLQDVVGVVIDPRPLSRGEHPVLRYWQDPASCEVVGGWYGYAPPPPTTEPTAAETQLATGLGTVRSLIVTGAGRGAANDVEAWRAAVAALGARGQHLHAPSRTTLEAGVDALCADVTREDSVVFIAAGPGTAASGGGLVLGAEAVSYTRLQGRIGTSCAGAGLIVWVVDSSHAGQLEPRDSASGTPPWLVHAASTTARPNAPRSSPHGGGLLSAALAALVTERATEACLTGSPAAPIDVAAAFAPDRVLDGMRALRWSTFGRSAGSASFAAATADLPERVGSVWGDLEQLAAHCSDDGACAAVRSLCPPALCHLVRCRGGRCVAVPEPGDTCDDGSACTGNDRCDALGLCEGSPLACDDGNPCTEDGCDPLGGCRNDATDMQGQPCDDGDRCTLVDVCDAAGECVGERERCDDDNPCTADECHPTVGCRSEPVIEPCDDGDPCTHSDACHDGVCSGTAVSCPQTGGACAQATCDADSGECRTGFVADGLPCDDGDPCTEGDACAAGQCAGQGLSCDDGLPCTFDVCEAGVCSYLPAPGTCPTVGGCAPVGTHPPGQPCALCLATGVVGPDPALDGQPCVSDGIACTEDRCEAGECAHRDGPFSCHRADGSCVSVGAALSPCLICAGSGVGTPLPEGTPCETGEVCRDAGQCAADGRCLAPETACCTQGQLPLGCGGTVFGDTSAPEALRAVDAWSCLFSGSLPGPEQVHTFHPNCDALVTFELVTNNGLLLLVRGDLEACGDGQCSVYSGGSMSQFVDEGEPIVLVVEAQLEPGGPYELSATCDCSD